MLSIPMEPLIYILIVGVLVLLLHKPVSVLLRGKHKGLVVIVGIIILGVILYLGTRQFSDLLAYFMMKVGMISDNARQSIVFRMVIELIALLIIVAVSIRKKSMALIYLSFGFLLGVGIEMGITLIK